MKIQCNHCGAVAETIEPKTAGDGELEYTFFLCPACKADFPIAVTDKKLRTDIAEYSRRRNLVRIKPVTEQFLRETEALKQENLKRCRELMDLHPLALFLEAHPEIRERAAE